MKHVLLITTLLGGSALIAQNTTDNKDKPKEKRIETIRIVNGDTVMHDIKIVRGDDLEWHDSGQKKVVIRRTDRNDEELKEILREMEIDEEIIREMDGQGHHSKVIRVEVNDDGETEVIDLDRRHQSGEHDHERRRMHRTSDGIRVFPNPSTGMLNVKFRLDSDEEAEVTVKNSSGKEVFKKEYNKKGDYEESIDISKEKKGVFIVQLNQKGRSETSKIILE